MLAPPLDQLLTDDAHEDARQAVLAVPSLLHSILLQLLDDPASLALLSLCACVNRLWRDTVYNNRDLWQRLCDWQRVFVPRTLGPDGFLSLPAPAPAPARDEDLVGHEADTSTGFEPEDTRPSEVHPATLRAFVARSRGTLMHLDVNPLGWVEADDVVRILSEHAYEGKLLSLRAGGVEIQRDGSSLRAFRADVRQVLAASALSMLAMAGLSALSNPDDGARRLARGDPEGDSAG